MTIELVREMLGWCSLINMGLLVLWGVMFLVAHDVMYRFHGKWFRLSVEQFDAMHYAGIGFYKITVILFNLVPYIALCIAG